MGGPLGSAIVTVMGGAVVDVDKSAINRLVSAICTGEGRSLRVGVVIVDDAESRRINRAHLQHDYETDVIAFDLGGASSGNDEELDGEIVVNGPLAAREARDRGHGADAELLFYVAHGVLHLLGYDDGDSESRQRMHDLQRHYLTTAGLPAPRA